MRRLRVVAGDWKQYSEDEAASGISVERRVANVYTHPSYDKEVTSDFDFALLELDKEMPTNDCIGPACLPSSPDETGASCSITGWGTLMSAGPNPEVLQQAQVQLLSNAACAQSYAAANETVTAAMVCASGSSQLGITDTCQGDSGGPLVCQDSSGRYVVRGVTSWGDGCALENFPGVYARVTSALPWIREVLAGGVASDVDEGEVNFEGAMWRVLRGNCVMDDSQCIQSPSFPQNYSALEACVIAVNASAASPIRVEGFSTEEWYDTLLVNCKAYSGSDGPEGVTPETSIYWLSDASINGESARGEADRMIRT